MNGLKHIVLHTYQVLKVELLFQSVFIKKKIKTLSDFPSFWLHKFTYLIISSHIYQDGKL